MIDRGRLYYVTLDQPDQFNECTRVEGARLLSDATDIVQLSSTSRTEIIAELETAWQRDRALQLTLILLDPNEDLDNRVAAAECLDEFLSNPGVRDYVGNRLYAAPLPSSSDLGGSIQLSSTGGLENLAVFLEALSSDQSEIIQRHQAWLELPLALFSTPEEKGQFYVDAVRFGAFRLFAKERGRKSWAILQLLSHPYFRGNARARSVFQQWAAPFKEAASGKEFEHKRIYEDAETEFRRESQRERTGVRPREAFEQAEKQREAIKALLVEGNEELALRFTEQLIAKQRIVSEPEHIAKSLCDLAQFAKGLGSPELQLEFAKKAIIEAPSDAWSYATVGDAYRGLMQYQEALDAYHEAGALGDARIALVGRAEVLKDLGQFSDALSLLETCIRDYPSDVVPRNAKAAALADYGMFNEAIETYDEILSDWPYDDVTRTGRAQVLKDSGQLEKALQELNKVILWYPNHAVPQYTRGEVFRELNQLEDALKIFEEMRSKFPLAAEVHASYARVLRDLGKFSEAIESFKALIKTHPLNPRGHVGLAETLTKVGSLDKAHEAYDVVIERFPRLSRGRNGKASIFMAQGQYADAIKLLSLNLPATFGEWVSYHIRAMGYLRSGKLERAERMFEWGASHVPWAIQQQYFSTALASLRIRQQRYPEGIALADAITNPSIRPVASLLVMHGRGALGDSEGVRRVYETISDKSAPIVVNLRDYIEARYVRQLREYSELELLTKECDSLLLAA